MTKYSPDAEPERQLPLNEKVGRILHSLARSTFVKASSDNDRLEVPEEVVSAAIRAWRERACYLPGELFSDPAGGCCSNFFMPRLESARCPCADSARHLAHRGRAPFAG